MKAGEGMKTGMKTRLGAALAGLAAAGAAYGQLMGQGPQTVLPSAEQVSAQAPVIREIDDPHTGARWLLMRNPIHPGGPGRLVLLANGDPSGGGRAAGVELQPVNLRPVIRAGERLVVEEHTQVVEARLEAVALNPAAAGSVLNARLKMGGKVVRAVALAPGRAVLQPHVEARP
jgi:hypothetical protein